MLDDYHQFIGRRLAPTSVRLRMYWIRKFAEHIDLNLAVTDDIFTFVEGKDWSPQTVQTLIASLKLFYQWAQAKGHLPTDITLDYPRVKVPWKKSRIATDDTIRAGLAVATPAEEAMLRLGSECGLRVSEIAALEREHRDGPWLEVHGKGGKNRPVYMGEELCTVLDELQRSPMRRRFYFPNRTGGHVAPSTIWRHVRNITGMNTHSLRHRAGTTVYRETGHDLRLTQVFLGHADPKTTAIYVHIERDELVRASDASRIAA